MVPSIHRHYPLYSTLSYIGVPTETNECVSHGESGSTCHPSIKQSGIDHCDLVAERDHIVPPHFIFSFLVLFSFEKSFSTVF